MLNSITSTTVIHLQHDPFGMMLSGRNWVVGSEYRYGFNGQEQDDEVYGNGNVNTAEFWQYDSRLARRWNLDPIVMTDASNYSAFRNNPIIYDDPSGASVDLGNLYEKDESGNYKHSERIKEFELFASTEAGNKYLLDHAQAGFELHGVFVKDLSIVATEEGISSKGGVDAKFEITEGKNAWTSPKLKGGYIVIKNGVKQPTSKATGARLEITYSIPGKISSKLWDAGDESTMLGVCVLLHEVFLHGDLMEKRYNRNLSQDALKSADHDPMIYANSLFYQKGWEIFNQAQLKLTNGKEIINESNFKLMFKIGTGEIGNRTLEEQETAKKLKEENKSK